MKPLVIGSRGSQLAIRQSRIVAALLKSKHPNRQFKIETVTTTGDRMAEASLAQMAESSKGLFVKEIEEALLERRIDLAVHSLKDVPTQLPDGLCLAAIPEREDPRDGLITSTPPLTTLGDLASGTKIGTSSLRRCAQLRALRPDLDIVPIRGNVGTRIKKMQKGDVAALMLAAAGLKRLGWDRQIAYTFSLDEMVPAVGQGALAIETRSDDLRTRELVNAIEHLSTRRCVLAERLFLEKLGGGCQLPLGAHASSQEDQAYFRAFVGNPDGRRVLREDMRGNTEDLEKLAVETADRLLAQDAQGLLSEWNHPQP